MKKAFAFYSLAISVTWALAAANPTIAAAYRQSSEGYGVKQSAEAKNFEKTSRGGIRESVPSLYRQKYETWKKALLSTEYARKIWDKYAKREDFQLNIKVSESVRYGAGTGDFIWDENGKLIGATITLGKEINKGTPDPVYYPVMNSISEQTQSLTGISDLLAAAKFIHELAHVTFTDSAAAGLIQKQNRIMQAYYNIFLTNGFNTMDPRLIKLQNELGAQPIDIWEDREYWSEVAAMNFLNEKISDDGIYCSIVRKVRINLNTFAPKYRDRILDPKQVRYSLCLN
jgi:hypothetical protein